MFTLCFPLLALLADIGLIVLFSSVLFVVCLLCFVCLAVWYGLFV